MSISRRLHKTTPVRHIISVLAALWLLAGCTSQVPRSSLPFPVTCTSCGDPVKVVTVPLPVIASSPNEGITVGALTAFLIHNKNDEISTMLAPQINHNNNFGVTASLYGAFYPSLNSTVELNLSQSGKINHAYEIRGRDLSYLDNKLELNAYLFKISDGSSRFFGFDAKSPQQKESNYANDEVGYTFSGGYQFGKHFQISLGDRFRDVTIRPGAVKKIPYIKNTFSTTDVPGINGFTTHAPRVSISYSTLNDRDTPTYGGYARFTFEPTMTELGGAANYRHYEVETKGFVPLDNGRYISVFRFMYNQTLGHDVPFLEQSILGGETTLRGYGRNRFIDNSFFLCNFEERIRLFRWEVFSVTADWELAPFIDFGAVMESLDKANGSNFEFNPGVGFRAIVRPNIVGRVDLGIGKDGPAIFVGLGYPF
ncbi:MAG TPA: BamA/TamA family outer membrane protein [Desulfuromonadales bacterium]|nr:BamA/TamA family outer membrane protein [Desulfuromonadales bacterium]